MPTVPVIQDTAKLEIGEGRRRVQASPNAFGALEAQGASKVVQGLGAVAETALDIDDEFNEANARELDNQLSARIRDRLYNPETGYLTTQRGRNAIDGRGQVEADIDGFAAELAANARNERAGALFRDVAQRRVGAALGDVAGYASAQTRAYQNQQSETALSEALDNAVAGFADPHVVAANIDTARSQIEIIAQREGWSPETRQARIREFQSNLNTRVVAQLAATDPEAALSMIERIRPSLSAQEAGELITTVRVAERQRDDAAIDEAWEYVAGGQRIPAEVWARVPGRSRIDIQNEQRRREEGGDGGGNRTLVEDMRVMAVADPDAFAREDLRAQRGALGSSYDELAIAQAQIRRGAEPPTVEQQRTTFNAIYQTAQAALAPLDFNFDEESDEGRAFRAGLLRELQSFQAAGGGNPTAEEAQILIGRAVVGMGARNAPRSARVGGVANRERVGRRGNSGADVVPPSSGVVVPYAAIPPTERLQIGTRLHERLGRVPTRGEVENAYAAFVTGRPLQIGGE